MDNRETYNGKTPFYMTYPMQNLYLAEMEYEKDMERMKEMYPKEISELQQMVERRADQMEYEGSRIYDENPDREMLREEAERIYREFLRWLEEQARMQPTPPEGQQPPPPRPMPPMREPEMPQMDEARPRLLQQPMMPQQPMNVQQPMNSQQPMMQPRQDGRFMLNPPREWGEIMQQSLRGMEVQEDGLEQAQFRDNRRCDNPWLCNLTQVLFHNEIYRRRCRNRRCRRWW